MSMFKKPSELSFKQTLTALIYGQAGVGKSTLAASAPNAVLLDFDGGTSRMNGAHIIPTLQVSQWEEVVTALDEVRQTPAIATIVIDTVGKMMAYMDDYIKRTNPKMRQYDGSLSLKGFGMRKQMFLDFLKSVSVMGRNVIFVAHEIEQKRGDETIIRPEVGGSSTNDLVKELDLVGYMEMFGNKRTISFTPCEKYYAKNACNMPGVIEVPVTVDEKGNAVGENDFMARVLANYHERLRRTAEETARYEALTELINSNVAAIANAEDANNFLGWVKGLEHVYNSKAVAQRRFLAKVASLPLKYNKAEKTYSDAEPQAKAPAEKAEAATAQGDEA